MASVFEIKYDKVSDIFLNKFNIFHNANFTSESFSSFLHDYFSLIDAYLSYNERFLTIEYFNRFPTKFNFDKNNIDYVPFSKIIIFFTKEEGYDKTSLRNILFLRNQLTHNFWLYFDENKSKILKKDSRNLALLYDEVILLTSLPKMKLTLEKLTLNKEGRNKNFENQWLKFSYDIRNKVLVKDNKLRVKVFPEELLL